MKKTTRAVLMFMALAGGLIATAPANAQGAYAGVDLVTLMNKVSGTTGGVQHDETYSTGHLRLKGGYHFTEMFGIEVQLISGNRQTKNDSSGTTFRMTTGPISGVYGRIEIPLGDSAGLYGLLGIASVSTEYYRKPTLGAWGPVNRDEHRGLSFGFGLDVRLAERVLGSVDFMVYRVGSASYPAYFTDKPDQVIRGIGGGLTLLF